jgi:phage/plasmid-associated DNA primase
MKNSRTAWIIFRRILTFLFIIFIILYFQVETGLVSEAKTKAIITQENIKKFEEDVKNGEYIDIKNYTEVLVEEAGEFILTWLIEGAKKAIDNHFHIEPPIEVIEAIEGYKEQSDSISLFINEKCDVTNKESLCPSGELYTKYRNYCFQCGEPAKSTTDFYGTLKKLGYKRVEMKHRFYIKGLSLIPIDLSSAADDFEELL